MSSDNSTLAPSGSELESASKSNEFSWLPPRWKWTFPDPEAVKEELKQEFTEEERAKAWNEAAQVVKTYHDELVEQWQKAMDSVLVYAGLFSAVLTAFNVQSYQLLQPDPTDPMLAVLQQISVQLTSFSINSSFINSTQPARSPDQLRMPFLATVSAVWINTLWFASLVCSLAAASIALIVKQWLYEMSRGLSGTSRETARLRQHRLNSLIKWNVGMVVLVPSMLLQIALGLFLSGLLILLWTIHETVAAVITALVCILFTFLVVVTILPIFRPDCCYRSPQAFALHVMAEVLWNGAVRRALVGIWRMYKTVLGQLHAMILDSESSPDPGFGIRLLDRLIIACHHDESKIPRISTWNGAEQTEVARDDGFLDRHIATMAYTTTFATERLRALHVILSDLPCDQVPPCFSDILQAWTRLWGADVGRRSQKLIAILGAHPFYCGLRKMLTVNCDERDRLGADWARLSCEPFLTNAAQCLPRSGQCLSTLAVLSIGDSALSRRAADLLRKRLPGDRVFVTYDVFQDIMAMARYNVDHWATLGVDQVMDSLGLVGMSLKCTLWALLDNPEFSVEQGRWICDEMRSLLSFSKERLTTMDAVHGHRHFGYQFVKAIVLPLVTICEDVSGGYRMVPEEFLTVQGILLPDEASWEEFPQRIVRRHFDELASAIRNKKRLKK